MNIFGVIISTSIAIENNELKNTNKRPIWTNNDDGQDVLLQEPSFFTHNDLFTPVPVTAVATKEKVLSKNNFVCLLSIGCK